MPRARAFAPSGTALASEGYLAPPSRLDAVWDRPGYRMRRFNLTPHPDEHPCFAGFRSMMKDTDRCQGWQRSYPDKGGKRIFFNSGINRRSNFTLEDTVAHHINVWLEENSTQQHKDVAVRAAQIYSNVFQVPELMPEGSKSWMEQECKVMGQMPFMYSCSNRINVLVMQCGFDNAFVTSSDYLVNYPQPVNNGSKTNADIIFYLCQELVDRNPNAYQVANTFAHELAHVIQGGFGSSSMVMMEGGATWLEGDLLHLAPRPMTYAWGFRDWNRINAAHFYAQSRVTNARKFYQIHAMLLTYLSQAELLGDAGASALQNYETFGSTMSPFGRNTYDYYFQHVGKPKPKVFKELQLDVKSVENPFGEVLLNFRVAWAVQCLPEDLRPKDPRYTMPKQLRNRPFWDCTSFPSFWANEGSAEHKGFPLHYGGAGIYRLASATNGTVALDEDADWQVRTKVLAAGTGSEPAEVRELRPGEKATFKGEREIFIVQVNVDPEGETLSRAEKGAVWNKDDCFKLDSQCAGKAWTTSKDGFYPNLAAEGLRTPIVTLPKATNISLSFKAWWDLEAVDGGFFQKTEQGCEVGGWDGVQVRLHIYHNVTEDKHEDGKKVLVLQPEGGYNHKNQTSVISFSNPGIRKPYSKAYANSCVSLDGYTGSSSYKTFAPQNFSLAQYAGKHVRVEVVFSSDSGVSMSGFWLRDLEIKADAKVVFNDTEALFGSAFVYSVPAGTTDPAGVPVVVAYPEGYEADSSMRKRRVVRRAGWSASWMPAPGTPREQYLGWSYQAHPVDTKTAKLHVGQEACIQLQAPFRGAPKKATLFTLVDKMGIRSVWLQGRASEALGPQLRSASPGVTDPGVHIFHFNKSWPTLEEGQLFLLCVSAGDVQKLVTDGEEEAFLHLPLANVPEKTTQDAAGRMLLRQGNESVAADELSELWKDHRIALRVEFVERPLRRLRGQFVV
ncbi:unnamed protein product [Effrenium voratum]|nr:unnamed protein product [Effrenium voratum]